MEDWFYYLLGIGVLVAHRLFQRWKLARALAEEIPDDQCASCGSKDLESSAPNTYCCRACGYAGGSGQAQAKLDQERQRIAGLSFEQRQAEALELLIEARTLVLASLGSFDGAKGLSTLDIIGIGSGADVDVELNDKEKLVRRGLGNVEEAQYLARRCKLLLELDLAEVLADQAEIHFDFEQYLDNIVSDLLVHKKILDAIENSRALIRKMDTTVAQLGGEARDSLAL